MDSLAASSSSARPHNTRAEAGPLPRKAGELGFHPAEHTEADITEAADTPSSPSPSPSPSQSSTTTPVTTVSNTPPTATTSTASLSTKPSSWWQRLFHVDSKPLIWGMHSTTLLKAVILILVTGGAAAAWALSTTRISAIAAAADGKPNKTTVEQVASYMSIFLHAAFAVSVLALIISFERTVFVLRAQYWLYSHPGETLPLHRGGGRVVRSAAGNLSTAPWNRPPLPTYAAALGYRGTGDAEDEQIAPAPPPAYGNTRGSVLLLASVLRRISGGSSSGNDPRRSRLSQLRSPLSPRTPRDFQQIPESRPVSYISTDGYNDIQRAHQLEQSLARLEANNSATTISTSRTAP